MNPIDDDNGVAGEAEGGGLKNAQRIGPFGLLVCEWCGGRFNPRSRFGRLPRFCRDSHRVRACERRRGLARPGQRPAPGLLPEPRHNGVGLGIEPTRFVTPSVIDLHERGATAWVDHTPVDRLRVHRTRPGAGVTRQDNVHRHGTVVSLCGARVVPTERPNQSFGRYQLCLSCERLAPLHPVDRRWWDAMTQRVAGQLISNLGSTVLAVEQAVGGYRDPVETLRRANQELRELTDALGLVQPPPASFNHKSTSCT